MRPARRHGVPAREGLDLPVIQHGDASINEDSNQVARQEPGVWPTLMNKDSMRRSAAKLHDATSFTTPVVKRGTNRREK